MKKIALFATSVLMAGIMAVSPVSALASSKTASSSTSSAAETESGKTESSTDSKKTDSKTESKKTDSKTESKKTDSKTDSKKNDSKTDSKTESKTESKKADTAADPTINVENQAFWREALQKYRHDDKVNQIMLVRCTEGCTATVQYYEKLTDENDVWSLTFETEAIIGKNGPGKTGEGDAKTPYGDFGVRGAFGIREDPGTELPYTEIKETTYACDEEGEYYNQIIDTEETGHDCKGEEMYELSPEYNYGIETDFNSENEYPKGSAIFIHCKGTKKFTGGCVALDEELMKKVLETADSGMRIIIHAD